MAHHDAFEQYIAMMQYMASRSTIRTKEVRDDGSIIELVVWELDVPVPPCVHRYKYRLFFGTAGACRVRYDNERDKGDHRHIDGCEQPYVFISVAQLLADFRRDVETRENEQ